MLIKDVLGINNAKLIMGNENSSLINFSKDTRTINKNDTYIGLKGENFNGNLFYEEAFKKGAKTCIIEGITIPEDIKTKYPDRNLIITDNTLEFLMNIAKLKRESINVPIIAITGSAGKTSTKNIIADTLSIKYKVLKTSGNLNTNIGVSLTLLEYQDEDIVVIEMGMNHKGEISQITNIAKPTIAIITNVGTAHIGYLKSRENILKAKLEIIEGLKNTLIINNDNDLLHDWYQKNNINQKIITYGIDTKSDYQATNISYNNLGINFTFKDKNVQLNCLGKQFIYNTLVALIISELFNIDLNKVLNKLTTIKPSPGRMELLYNHDITIINDTYNANYDSVYYALDALNHFKGRKIAVLGDILELGDYGEQIHRQVGNLIKDIDLLITVGPLAKYINDEALKNGFDHTKSYHFSSNKEAISFINNIKEPNDTILIKASNGMHFNEIIDNLKGE